MRCHDAGSQTIGVQSPSQRLVIDLFVGETPEFVAEDWIVVLMADENKFDLDCLRRGPRRLGRDGCRCFRGCGWRHTAAPARGQQGETDGCGGMVSCAVEHGAEGPQREVWGGRRR